MNIKDFSVTPSATADGVSTNIASIVIVDDAGSFASGVNVVFTVNQDAIFPSGLQEIVRGTDALGTAFVAFTDRVPQEVTVTAYLLDEPQKQQSLTTLFVSGATGVPDKIELLLTVDQAKANGQDENQVILQAVGGTEAVPQTEIGVSLSNGAHFVDGSSTAQVITGLTGTANLAFTNTNIGSAILTAYIPTNIAISNKVESTFVDPTPELTIILEVVSDNAAANGKAVNTVLATVLERASQKPISGVQVVFTTTGSASFEGGSVITTDSNGQAFAALVNGVEETVKVTATTGSASSTTNLTFESDASALPLRIVRIFNHNKEFELLKGVTSAWDGAVFTVEAAGGMGSYTWSVLEGNDILSISDANYNAATLHFSSRLTAPAEREYAISLSDGEQTVVRKFTITTFFSKFGRWQLYGTVDDIYPSVEKLKQLYTEWGDMRSYDGWVDSRNGTHYWTNDQTVLYADAVNMTNGDVDNITYNWRCGFAS